MYLKPVDRLPEKHVRNSFRANNKLKELVLSFYNSTDEYAEVEFQHGEYLSNQNLYSGIKRAIKALDLPLEVDMIQGGIYLRRTE